MEDIELENTPQNNWYEDETQNEQSCPQLAEELEPMPEVRDHYIGVEILLSRGDQLARGHVVAQSSDPNGNIMGISFTNPMFDTRLYQVEFAGGEVKVLMANIIAKLMYTQCEADGNEYLLLDVLVDCHKDNKVISLSDQQTTLHGRPVICETTEGWQI